MRSATPAIAFLLPSIAIFAPLGAAPVFLIATTLTIVSQWRLVLCTTTHFVVLGVLLAALGIWASLSGLWSIIPTHSLLEGLRFLGESACGLVLVTAAANAPTSERRRTTYALAFGIACAVGLLALERFDNEPILR